MVTLQSLSKAMALIDVFTAERPEWALADLSRALGLPKPTTHHILSTLAAGGWVEQSSDGKYRLGLRLWEKGRLAIGRTPLREAALPHMQSLAQQCGECVRLGVLDVVDPRYVVYIDIADSTHAVREQGRPGDRAPSHCVATGKTLLAFSPDAYQRLRQCELPRFTDRTITAPSRLSAELQRVRRNGLSVNRKEYRNDIIGMAAPIRSHDGQVTAAIGISGPAYRLDEARLGSYKPALLEAAAAISARLGHLQLPDARSA